MNFRAVTPTEPGPKQAAVCSAALQVTPPLCSTPMTCIFPVLIPLGQNGCSIIYSTVTTAALPHVAAMYPWGSDQCVLLATRLDKSTASPCCAAVIIVCSYCTNPSPFNGTEDCIHCPLKDFTRSIYSTKECHYAVLPTIYEKSM